MERKLSEYLENIIEGTQCLELFHCIDRTVEDGFKYALTFTDDFSGPLFVYFLRYKSDSVIAFKPFLADSSPIAQVKRLRCDNGGKFTNQEYISLLRAIGIKQELTWPESPYQNVKAERYRRTFVEMDR